MTGRRAEPHTGQPMSAPQSQPSPLESPLRSQKRRFRIWILAALVLGQFVWLVSHFTTATLPESEELWVQVMRKAKALPQIALAVVSVLLLFRKPAQREDSGPAPSEPPAGAGLALLVAAQCAGFLLLVHLTSGIFEHHLEGVEQPLLAIALWLLVACATSALGVLLFVRPRVLFEFLARRGAVLLGGCGLGLAAWVAGQYASHQLSLPLRAPTLWLADLLLAPFEKGYIVDAVNFDIHTFGEHEFWVRIAPECSGFEGMGLMAVFSVSFVWVFRERLRLPQALLLPFAGVLGIWVLNVVRIVVLVWIGTHVSPEIAVGGFHSLAGTFAFCVAAFLVVLASRTRFFSSAAESGFAGGERDGTAAYLVPFLLSVALGMVASALGADASFLPLLGRLVLPVLALLAFRRAYSIRRSAGWLAALGLGAVAFAIWVGLPELEALREGGARLPYSATPWVPLRILGSVLVTPVVEELAFRGFLLRRLGSTEFDGLDPRRVPLLALALSSVLFGVLHEHWLAATIAGALYGYAYMRRGEILDCILAHAFTNLLLVVLAAASGDWSLL